MKPMIQPFFDSATHTFTYIVYDQPGGHAAIIDPILSYNAASARTHTDSADQLIAFIQDKELTLEWILETHAHADHLTSAHYIQQQIGGKTGIGLYITRVQQIFARLFDLGNDFIEDKQYFDHLFEDNEMFQVGQLKAHVIHVPGHTPADIAYCFEGTVFVGDTLFMPDVGTARCDFPGGNANSLYQSVQRIMTLPDETELYMCHDYPPTQRQTPAWQTTVGEQKQGNIHINQTIDEDSFVTMRQTRDKTLELPTLIIPSIQVNIYAGKLPDAQDNGIHYLKIPLNTL